jgi:hypothetical protein
MSREHALFQDQRVILSHDFPRRIRGHETSHECKNTYVERARDPSRERGLTYSDELMAREYSETRRDTMAQRITRVMTVETPQRGTEYLAGLYILTEDITYDPVLWLQYGRNESTNNKIEKLVDIAAPGQHNL